MVVGEMDRVFSDRCQILEHMQTSGWPILFIHIGVVRRVWNLVLYPCSIFGKLAAVLLAVQVLFIHPPHRNMTQQDSC